MQQLVDSVRKGSLNGCRWKLQAHALDALTISEATKALIAKTRSQIVIKCRIGFRQYVRAAGLYRKPARLTSTRPFNETRARSAKHPPWYANYE